MYSINTLSVAQMLWWWWCLMFRWRGIKPKITKSFVSREDIRRVLANQQLPQTTRWWLWLWVHITSFQGGNKHTYPHTDSTHMQTGPCDSDKLSTHAQHITTRIHTIPHTHTHTLQRYGARFDNRQVDLALVRLEWSKKSKADPREGWGFCVCGVSHFITRETHNRPRKTFEAMGGVCGNRLCGYLWCQLQYSDCRLFPGLGLCLSAEGETVWGLYIREQTS